VSRTTTSSAQKRRIAVVGVGKRVREAVLPALRAIEESFEVVGLYARGARVLEAAGREWSVEPLTQLRDLQDVDLLYVAVAKDAVPSVLRQLLSLGASDTDLLIDTPVVRFRHFRHIGSLSGFRRVGVPEDCAFLPWIGPVRECLASGVLGELDELVLWKSGYAYHGLATAKAILGANRIRRARRVPVQNGLFERYLRLDNQTRATIVEPRDYAAGWVQAIGSKGSLCDQPRETAGTLYLEATVRGGLCRTLRVGDHVAELDEAEASLTADDPEGASVIARQESMKRVGLLRVLRDVRDGGMGYPLQEALEDMVVDYWLQRLGRYRATPLTDPGAPLARGLFSLLSRLGG
jgi:hypothetical protein